MKTKQLFTALFNLLFFTSFAQNVITVDNSVGANAEYDDLQDAIDSAPAGETIYVHASELSYGNIVIDKQIILVGYGHSNETKNTFIEGIVLEDNASGSRFTGIYVFDELVCQNSVSQINSIVIENCRIDELDFGSSTFYEGANNVLIRGSIVPVISGYMVNAIISSNIITRVYIGQNYQSVTLKNNIFFRPNSGSPYSIINQASADGSITVQNNIFYSTTSSSGNLGINSPGVVYEYCLSYTQNGSGTVYEIMNGSNNLDNINPLFVNIDNGVFEADEDDYHLQEGSPAIGTGAGGVDIGLYDGSPFIFNNFGFTAGIPTVTINAITEQVAPGDNVEVTIQTNSN